jgi:hypothetical protein
MPLRQNCARHAAAFTAKLFLRARGSSLCSGTILDGQLCGMSKIPDPRSVPELSDIIIPAFIQKNNIKVQRINALKHQCAVLFLQDIK